MGKRIGAIATACLALALCLAFAGCGASVDKSLYTGTWALESSNDSTFDAKTLELMKSLDVQVSLTLNDDGTGTLNLLGNDPHAVTWQASSNSEGELEIDGSTAKLTLEEGKLTMTDASDVYMAFVRSDAPTADVESASAQAASSSAAASGSADAAAAQGTASAGANDGESANDTDEAEAADEAEE